MRFSDEEKYIIGKMLLRMEIKKKRLDPQRNMTNVNVLMKSGIGALNKIVKNQSIEMVDDLNQNKLRLSPQNSSSPKNSPAPF